MQIAFAASIGWMIVRQRPNLESTSGTALIALAGAATVWINARDAEAHQGRNALTTD